MSVSGARIQILLIVSAFCLSVDVCRGEPVDFRNEIYPLLQRRCFECHGQKRQRSSLRVDSREAVLRGGDSGAAVVPGNPDASYLLDVLAPAADPRMPPEGEPLKAEEIERMRRWIQEGADWPADLEPVEPASQPHWAFQPLTRAEVPVLPATVPADARHPVDAFLWKELQAHGLTMSPEAEPGMFLRRVTLDLTGLLPTPEELQQFLQACRTPEESARLNDEAVAALVDRLLASPRYGERWAQHWLDVIRFAETAGYEKNGIRPMAWPYRDYVIQALNQDIPYPQFIAEQLAGDQLGKDPATGFLVTPPLPEPKEVGLEPAALAQVRFNSLDEVVQNVSSAMLGITVACARCHDHKFDPISSRDYYRLVANFGGLQFDRREWNSGDAPEPTRQRLRADLASIRRELLTSPVWREEEPTRVTEVIQPTPARWIRFTVSESEGEFGKEHLAFGVDELEVWTSTADGAPAENVALATAGTQVRTSGGNAELDSCDAHLIDGVHGSGSLWIAKNLASEGPVWVELELPRVTTISRIAYCRDRLGLDKNFSRLGGRSPRKYTIELATEPGNWKVVASEPRSEETISTEQTRLEKTFAEKSRQLDRLSYVFAGRFEAPPPMHVLKRGDPQQPKEEVAPGGLDILGGYELSVTATDPERRLALARWLGSPENPLTSRVLVNRIWHHHFGTGLVSTPSDFGTQGERPTHPALLDWLASEFIAKGWSIKQLHRLICNSRAYRQDSRPQPEALAIDADSRLLWRFPPRRLEAEAIRDNLLLLSGSLNQDMGGPGTSLFKTERFGGEYLPLDNPGRNTWRRMIYLTRVRGADDGLFKAFDIPDCGQVRAKRTTSTTPLQALNLFNSPFTSGQAELWAQRLQAEDPHEINEQVTQMFLSAYSRLPTEVERAACVDVAQAQGLATVCRAVLNSNEFLFLE
ncbi:PSD1 and planctomycete cytochrome C domain-containing protein [Planctomicrobium sp. SH664]|uniref:PSD1 and planctomycete cytochrome C domain-containing protein n=1 Tax=Planctomicrobium sp. SH664 TaxID=3448125 RepID=UPI003F5AFA7B